MEDRSRSLAHVLGRLGVVEARVGAEVARRRAGDAAPDDRFRGLYFSDEELARLLQPPAPPAGEDDGLRARVEAQADADEAAGHDLRLQRLRDKWGAPVFEATRSRYEERRRRELGLDAR
jgi:hypothetical protein